MLGTDVFCYSGIDGDAISFHKVSCADGHADVWQL